MMTTPIAQMILHSFLQRRTEERSFATGLRRRKFVATESLAP
jgi:hypothetical protein